MSAVARAATGPLRCQARGRKGKAAAGKAKAAGSDKLAKLFVPKPKNFSIGGDILPKTAKLERVRKWPKYVRIQRQRKVLLQRLKVPPAVNVFASAAESTLAKRLLTFFKKYAPEEKKAKKERLRKQAEITASGGTVEVQKVPRVKYGLNHVTDLIESKKAQLVIIAHDVQPLELVLWLPTLCHRMGVPFAIVKGRSRLGAVVHKKKATCLALTGVKQGDLNELGKLKKACSEGFNDVLDSLRRRGEMQLGVRAQHRNARIAKERDAEERKRQGY